MHLQCTFLYSDQGRRNDLISTRQVGLPFTLRTTAAGTRSCTRRLAFYQSAVPSKNIASERDHCNPLTQCSTVSSGFSCHTHDNLLETAVIEQRSLPFCKSLPLSGFMSFWMLVLLCLLALSVLQPQCLKLNLWEYFTDVHIVRRKSSANCNNFSKKLLSWLINLN